jgi:hypothetical protein
MEWEFPMLRHYKEGTLSLEGLAKKLDLSISEAIDLLAKLGIEAPIELDDYLKGFNVLRDKQFSFDKVVPQIMKIYPLGLEDHSFCSSRKRSSRSSIVKKTLSVILVVS